MVGSGSLRVLCDAVATGNMRTCRSRKAHAIEGARCKVALRRYPCLRSPNISKSPATELSIITSSYSNRNTDSNIAPFFSHSSLHLKNTLRLPEINPTSCDNPLLHYHHPQIATMASSNYDSQASTNYKEAFSLFDKHGNGRVTLSNLGDLLRACGQNPTQNEIRELEKSVGGDCES